MIYEFMNSPVTNTTIQFVIWCILILVMMFYEIHTANLDKVELKSEDYFWTLIISAVISTGLTYFWMIIIPIVGACLLVYFAIYILKSLSKAIIMIHTKKDD